MGRGDEDDALDAGQRLEEVLAAESFEVFRGDFELIEVFVRDGAPECVAAFGDRQFGKQPALAVPDDDHLPQRRIFAFGIEFVDLAVNVHTQFSRGVGDGVAAVIDEVPELEVFAQRGVGPQGVPHLSPPDGAAEGAVDEDDRDAARHVRLREVDRVL